MNMFQDSSKEMQASPTEPPLPRQLSVCMRHLVNGLVAKKFAFIAPETSPDEMQQQLKDYDAGRVWLSNKIFGFVLSGSDLPGFAETVFEHMIGFGTQAVDDTELAALQQLMRTSFPLCATNYSRLYGPRFVGILHGDHLTEKSLHEAMDAFEAINCLMMQLGGRLILKLLGKPVVGINASAATGSLIVVGSTSHCADVLYNWVSNRPLRSDTIVNQLKESVSRWQFWLKAAFGMIEYKPHQLRQEVIVVDAETSQATSTAPLRLGFEFGFSLNDILAPLQQ